MLLLVSVGSAGQPARATTDCTPRLLVLSAFPGEVYHILARTPVQDVVTIDGRSYFTGTLEGNDVVVALTGIGLVNAETTTRNAIEHFGCGGITGIVFSGVSGGTSFIGDVIIPARWTRDGSTWFAADADMLDVARSLDVALERGAPVGDVACVGADPDLVRTVAVDHTPQIIAGGDGHSADPFGDRAFPCVPSGGDVFGCEACHLPGPASPDVARFVTGIQPFVDPGFFFDYFSNPPGESTYDAEDMETAAVAEVAAEHTIPFIAFRALSDGKGDPLMLPGFPVQFFAYRQLAADNAAAVALAFLQAWAAA